MAKSTYLKNKILDAIFNSTAYSVAADVYISLHTADPGITGANEVTGGTYTRQQVPFNAAASGSTKNTSSISFTLMPTATVTHIGIYDALAGNFLEGAALSTSISVTVGNTLTITAEHIIAAF